MKKKFLTLLAFGAMFMPAVAETFKVPATEKYPYYYSVDVPDGNYRVTVVLGSKKKNTSFLYHVSVSMQCNAINEMIISKIER